MALPTAFRRLTPIERDAALFVAAFGLLLATVWAAVSFGVSFDGPARGLAPWAAGVMLVAVMGFGVVVWYWYYVFQDERAPARGEFTRSGGHLVHGAGSYRTKALGQGVLREPEARMAGEAGFVPRTRARWVGWVVLMALALAAAATLASYAQRTADPLAPLLVMAGLLGGAMMLGAMAVGEFAHEGAWTRRERPPGA